MLPRLLAQREQKLIAIYAHCQLAMTPQEFYAKWQVNHEAIALICSRSTSTVRCWFARGRSHRRPQPHDLRHLALMDFLLEHFEEISRDAFTSPGFTSSNRARSRWIKGVKRKSHLEISWNAILFIGWL